ncbi:MAG: ribonucleoside triphosphate reductase [Candidatus Alcyoniella australis]|nr:ribonucleoside triphosphate reductase [Candidatus Alcyoniella australis]
MATRSKIFFILKRDGRKVEFDAGKIASAVGKAFQANGEPNPEAASTVTRQLVSVLEVTYDDKRIPNVEKVQDLVEVMLMENGHPEVAKRYILYRDQHSRLRHTRELFASAIEMIDDYIGRNDWRINENSNMSYSLQGLNNHISSSISSYYWLTRIYPPEIGQLHSGGDVHIHDLGMLAVYCCGWDLEDLLLNGFCGAFGKIESKPAKHFSAALGQIVNFFYTMQGEAAGAQAFSSFDTLLAPLIRFDGLNYDQVKQKIQEFVFNTNVPTRVGFQTPFTNITMDLVPSPNYRDMEVIRGGKRVEGVTYGEFQPEMDIINRAFAEVMMAGDAKGRIFTFPIPTYNITKDFDWTNENLDSLWEMTAKYGIPYFSNFLNSDLKPEDARSMCCRLRLDNRELISRGGGLFGANPLTGSIGVVTINMPRIGYLTKSCDEFLGRLGYLMDMSRDSLELKREQLERFTDAGLYPYSTFYLSRIKDGPSKQFWSNHFSTIGLIGMNEACVNLLGVDIAHPEGQAFAIQVLEFMRERIRQYQVDSGNLYNLEATPAEGSSYRLAKADRKLYPNIFAQGESEPFYTNSSQLPVDYTDDLFEALEHQEQLQTMYTGGTVLHGFIGEKINNPEACKLLVRRIAENFRLPYYSITPTFSICPVHGYIAGEHFECPYSVEEAKA